MQSYKNITTWRNLLRIYCFSCVRCSFYEVYRYLFVIIYVIILTIVEYAINMIVNKMSKADRCLNIRFSVKSIPLFNSWVRRIVFCAYLKCRDVACRTSPGGNSWNCHIHLMRCAARQFGGGASPESLTTNPFHIVHKLQEARRKVCSTTWNAKVYYILLVLFLLSCAFASKHFAMTVYVRKLKFVEFMLTMDLL